MGDTTGVAVGTAAAITKVGAGVADGDGGLLMVAGARSGKLRDILAYNLFSGICSLETILLLDPKGELAAISQNQTPDGKHCRYWNPLALHGLPQDRVNILEPYVTTREKGTGLGLAIVNKIVEEHGGEMTFTSVETGGTRVTMRFARDPLAKNGDGQHTG